MKQSSLLDQESHFAFGKNWQDFAAKIDESRIEQAISDLSRLSGRNRLDGLRFLDIGCGSGLHALAAHRLGASEVVGVDIDPDSVSASLATFARFAPTANARFETISVFDMTPDHFGGFEIVYSWGVLHHTGDMDRALRTAAALVVPGGLFLVALYGKTRLCGVWCRIKRWYSRTTPFMQRVARQIYIGLYSFRQRTRGRTLEDEIALRKTSRGMDFYIDVHDWLGGYPYESITPDCCIELLQKSELHLERPFLPYRGKMKSGWFGTGCDEYCFVRDCHTVEDRP
jgi:2-polyprenyl-6-hydroxyphenyl methylase/3-demethylubiquinone-9 3-methyltransferase